MQERKVWNDFVPPGQAAWKVNTPTVHNCDYPAPKFDILIPLALKHKADYLSVLMGNTEWIGYLKGKLDPEKKEYTITDIVIPEQNVNACSATPTEIVGLTGIVGTIHSHHSMGNFLSATDQDSVVGNHDVSIVVSEKGWTAWVKWKTPCDAQKVTEIEISWVYPGEVRPFAEKAMKKIHKQVYTAPAYVQQWQPSGTGAWEKGGKARELTDKLTALHKPGELIAWKSCDGCREYIEGYLLTDIHGQKLCPDCFATGLQYGQFSQRAADFFGD